MSCGVENLEAEHFLWGLGISQVALASTSLFSHSPSNALPTIAHVPAEAREYPESPDSPDLRLIPES